MSSRRVYARGDLVPGTVYRVVGVLGEGGMGLVYEVVDTSVDAPYVMKTLHRDLVGRKDLAKRMQAEAKALANLRHPNIVRVYTAGITADGVPFYIMDKLNGQSLRLLLKRKGGKLPMANAIVITVQLLSALDKAHERSIIHRDVKPDNVFLHVEEGETSTKLLDFGVMALLSEGSRETGRHFQGTLRYASPEQVAGLKVSPKTDLYAAALVLYEMLAGRGPFAGRTDMEIARAHLNDAPPHIGKLVPGLRPDLEALIMSALAKNPDDRPRDAFRFATDLKEIGHQIDLERGGDTLANSTLDTLLGELHDAMTEARPRSAVSSERTDVGMDRPPLEGSTLEDAPRDFSGQPGSADSAPARQGTPPAVDRRAATRTTPPSAPRVPKHGTEPIMPFVLATTAPSPALPAASAKLPAPDPARSRLDEADIAAAQSHAAAVRSLSAASEPSARRHPSVAAPLAVLAAGAVVAGIFFLGRASSTSPPSGKLAAAPAAAPAEPPPSAPATPASAADREPAAPAVSAALIAASTPPRPARRVQPPSAPAIQPAPSLPTPPSAVTSVFAGSDAAPPLPTRGPPAPPAPLGDLKRDITH